ncbi:MAG: DNA polymerase III subunit delta [Clostridia bacterium]|nr:DNA polymerase III subunit delta [Clostridia bacterium]
MQWSEFFRSVDAGDIAPVYLFTGPEAHVKEQALLKLRQKLLPPGLEALNDAVMEGVTAQQITDAAETLPMMCTRRIVTVRDWAPLMSGKSRNEEQEVAWMQRWLENPAPGCALVFYMRQSADGKKKFTATLRKKAVAVDFEPLSDAELSRWCAKVLGPRGKKINARALGTLSFMAGRELTRLNGELDKLCAYLGDRTEITEADVRAIVPASLEYNVFELLNHLLAGDMLKAQQTVNSMMQGGQNPVGILAMLSRQVRQLALMKCAIDAGESVQAVQERLKMHPYAAKQTARQCTRLPQAWLLGLYDACVSCDYAVKSGRMRDQDALSTLLFRIGLSGKSR